MNIKRTIPLLALFALTGILAAIAPAAPSAHNQLAIRHQLRGCHAWSLNGGAYKVGQTVSIYHGGALTVVNHDVMPHKLVQTSGPAVTYTRVSRGGMIGLKGTYPAAMLARMGSTTAITFSSAGVYRFTTKPGEDYMSGIKTMGEDNVLHLTVRVN
jgi:hypothetical protein